MAGSRPKRTPKASARNLGVREEREEESKREREAQAEKNQREKKIKEPPESPIQQQKSSPKYLTDKFSTAPNLPVTLPAEEESSTGTSPGVPLDLPAEEEAATEAATGTAPD